MTKIPYTCISHATSHDWAPCLLTLRNEATGFTRQTRAEQLSACSVTYSHIARASPTLFQMSQHEQNVFLRMVVLNKMTCAFSFQLQNSVAFSANSFCFSFGNVKIIVNNPNHIYLNVSILTMFSYIALSIFHFVYA